MIDHIDLPVRDIAASRDFYTAALAPLGYTPGPQLTATVGCLLAPVPGGVAAPVLWLHEDPEARGDVHVAFTAADRATVHASHHAARAAGGKDNGAPRERPEYHPGYYAAYVLDPDGVPMWRPSATTDEGARSCRLRSWARGQPPRGVGLASPGVCRSRDPCETVSPSNLVTAPRGVPVVSSTNNDYERILSGPGVGCSQPWAAGVVLTQTGLPP